MNASIEYIAGFFDGEGCIRATVAKDGKNASGLHVFITNTYFPILSMFEQKFGGTTSLRNNSNPKHKATYQWRMSSRKEIKNFLEQVEPYLIEKREQALLALEYCALPILKANRYSSNYDETIEARNKRIEIAKQLSELKHIRMETIS